MRPWVSGFKVVINGFGLFRFCVSGFEGGFEDLLRIEAGWGHE